MSPSVIPPFVPTLGFISAGLLERIEHQLGGSAHQVVLALARNEIKAQIDRAFLRHLCNRHATADAIIHNDLSGLFQRHHLQKLFHRSILRVGRSPVLRRRIVALGFDSHLSLLGGQGHVSYVINTIDINQHNTRLDGYEIRRTAVENNVTVFTALETVKVLLDVLEEITLRVSTIDSK